MEFATGAMGSLLNKLGELLKEEYKLHKGIREQVQSLSRELEFIHAALRKVAEVPREQLDEQVKLWAHDVRELSYDMEDIVDTFLMRVEDGRETTSNPHWLKKLMEKMGNWFRKGKACHQIAKAIEGINKQVQEVANRHSRYTADSIVSTPIASMPIDPRLQALYREALVGIDGKREEFINMLFEGDDVLSEGDNVSNKTLKIVSIVGFGGLGKNTLAKAVYDKINQGFHCSAFVPVGRNPNLKKVFRDILIDLDKENCMNLNMTMLDEKQLIDKLREFLKDKRYLIIIDDIWDEKHWTYIKWAFSNGNNLGSRLITTTRKVSVSKACCSSSDDIVYEMEPLSDIDSQRLFYQRIFSDRNGCPRELEQVSRDILKKCGGVPLAIITIASLLASNKQTKDEWYTVLNSIGHGLTEHACVEEMQRILSFSYYDLPSQLKTCLLYLSIFPEDYEIKRDRLIWRWIAEGFIQCKKQQTSLFKLGESYFNELINRSMIQPVDIDCEGKATTCRVHDMVLDLICGLSSEENFVTILDGTEESTPNLQSKVCRLSLQHSKVDEITPLVSVSQVRSITIFRRASINLMPPLSSLDVLRVLDLEGSYFGGTSPFNLRHVGNLFQLRYLGLAHTYIRELPEEIGELRFLQVLDIRGNYNIMELPSTIVKLRRLCLLCMEYQERYLGNLSCMRFPDGIGNLPRMRFPDGIGSLPRMRFPDGIGNLTSMEVLHRFSTEGCPNNVKELRNLTRLRELKIYFGEDESSKELEEAFLESLCNLHNIKSLVLEGCFRSMDLLGECWVPPRHLRRFHSHWVNVDVFSTLPTWVKRDPSLLADLSELYMAVKEVRQEDLQILGRLPALRSLNIESTHQTQRILLVSADWFPYVIFFIVFCKPIGHITFQRGALPRAQEVHLYFHLRMASVDGDGGFYMGLENLLFLRYICITIFHDGATIGEVKKAEAMLRDTLDDHPNHLTIHIDSRYRHAST